VSGAAIYDKVLQQQYLADLRLQKTELSINLIEYFAGWQLGRVSLERKTTSCLYN
jgi:hypothetical protein